VILAAYTTQQKLGITIGAVLVVGWALYLLAHFKKAGPPPGAEIQVAPNRKPYFEDDMMETKRLDRSLGVAAILLAIISIGLPAYWIGEGARQEGAVEYFDHRAVHHGYALFLPADSPEHGAHFGCADCHGLDGGGGVAEYSITDTLGRTRQVRWRAPAVNTVAYRYDTDSLRAILVYGRAGTPMPAWGTKGGGPMTDQQINDLIQYMQTDVEHGGLKISEEEAKAQTQTGAEVEARRMGKVDAAGNPVIDGEVLFNANCSRCHTRGWSYGEPEVTAGGRYGPSLRGGATIRQFPNAEDMVEFITEGVGYGQPYGTGGIGQTAGGGMPHFGHVLTPEQIAQIIEYERSL
jgi:mono/diheme cytochrome c family protein